jgi:RimJ/RimL family protein N-acetyltransferase
LHFSLLYSSISSGRIPMQFSFNPANETDRALIHAWVQQPHIQEWMHGVGLKNTLEGLEKFLKGDVHAQHWIAYDKQRPFGYLLTSEVMKTSPDEDPEIVKWCQKEGTAITLDLFICDTAYLGKGFAVPMIHEFLMSCFPHVSEVFIDPEIANARAVHVYQKAGFQILDTFIAKWHPVPHYRMLLRMSDLRSHLQGTP